MKMRMRCLPNEFLIDSVSCLDPYSIPDSYHVVLQQHDPAALVEGEDLAKDDPYLKHFNVEIDAAPVLPKSKKLQNTDVILGDTVYSSAAALPKKKASLEDYKVMTYCNLEEDTVAGTHARCSSR